MMTTANSPDGWTTERSTTDDVLAAAFAAEYPVRPVPADGPIDSSPIATTPSVLEDLDALWGAVVTETRTRGNDIHLPVSLAFAERLCRAYPAADVELVRVSTLLHDTGWAHVDESRIISEGFSDNWRTADIRYEHEREGCAVARRVLPALGYSAEFIERVCLIIDGHDTRSVAYSLEDALMRDADRLWRFDHVGIALASSWFRMDPAVYTDRLISEILPELITQAALEMATADIARSRALLKTAVLR
jgi:hypothetical protein